MRSAVLAAWFSVAATGALASEVTPPVVVAETNAPAIVLAAAVAPADRADPADLTGLSTAGVTPSRRTGSQHPLVVIGSGHVSPDLAAPMSATTASVVFMTGDISTTAVPLRVDPSRAATPPTEPGRAPASAIDQRSEPHAASQPRDGAPPGPASATSSPSADEGVAASAVLIAVAPRLAPALAPSRETGAGQPAHRVGAPEAGLASEPAQPSSASLVFAAMMLMVVVMVRRRGSIRTL